MCGILPKKCHVAPSPLDTQTTPLATRDIVHSTRVGILSGRLSTISGYLTVVILSGPAFHHLRIYHIRRLSPDGRGGRFNFPGQTCPDPNELVVGWERSTIQLPRTDMSGSSGNAYLENIRSRRFSFLGQTCPNPLVTLTRTASPDSLAR